MGVLVVNVMHWCVWRLREDKMAVWPTLTLLLLVCLVSPSLCLPHSQGEGLLSKRSSQDPIAHLTPGQKRQLLHTINVYKGQCDALERQLWLSNSFSNCNMQMCGFGSFSDWGSFGSFGNSFGFGFSGEFWTRVMDRDIKRAVNDLACCMEKTKCYGYIFKLPEAATTAATPTSTLRMPPPNTPKPAGHWVWVPN